MNAPWMDRLPTREEVEAHAAAHGRLWWPEDPDGVPLGLWMWRAAHANIPSVGVVRVHLNREVRMWSEDLGDEFEPGEGQWLPLTADGLPVALVTELDAVRAALVRVHELAATLNNRAAHGRGCQRSTRCTCGLAAISEELFADELLALLEVKK